MNEELANDLVACYNYLYQCCKELVSMGKDAKPIRKIRISNFGALGEVSLRLDRPLQIMIGPQASGKSTLGKTIYFCRKIRDYLTEYAREIWNSPELNDPYTGFLKFLRNPFMGCFGTTKHMDPFVIQYVYDDINGKNVTIKLGRANYVDFRFSEKLRDEIIHLLNEAASIAKAQTGGLAEDFYAHRTYMSLFQQQVRKLFADDETLLYIPAGRNLLATIPDLILPETTTNSISRAVDISQIDLITQDFIHYIQQMRGRFGSKLDEITQTYLKTVKGEIRNRDVELACELIKDILKGEYVNDKDGEKLYYNKDSWIKLMFGSSGQQEVLWALNCVFLAILQNDKTFLVFEEPESHIFPDSQEVIAQLVALMINSTNSDVFLTTHSPYMLTAINLLIFSGKIEKGSNDSIIERRFRLRPSEVDAYLIPKSKAKFVHLVSQNDDLIDAEKIDSVSEQINRKMDALLMQEIRQNEEKRR